jgi:threonine/homoserine/homoserine lactone efflux protein
VFSIVLDSSSSLVLLTLYGTYMSLATFVWFAFVSYLFTNPEIVKKYGKFSSKFEKILGYILLLIASQILLYEIPKINV